MRKSVRWLLVISACIILGALCYKARALDVYTVDKVYDGDTIRIEDGRHIRLIGIDAPEVDSPYGKAEPYGDQSREYLENMLLNKRVRLEIPPDAIDKYGRTLAYVYLRDMLVNGRIVRDGYARAYTYFYFSYRELFTNYESEARARGLGMWAGNKKP